MERRFVLASGSPRRKELLAKAGIAFDIVPADIEEKTTITDPAGRVRELSLEKAQHVYDLLAGAGAVPPPLCVIGSDTLVACDGKILGKPRSHEEAVDMITMLQGRSHEVFTGVTLIYEENASVKTRTFSERTEVEVYPMTGEQVRAYADTEEPYDKAGGYGIQGAFAIWVRGIRGDYNNVVGLPLARLCLEMRDAGLL